MSDEAPLQQAALDYTAASHFDEEPVSFVHLLNPRWAGLQGRGRHVAFKTPQQKHAKHTQSVDVSDSKM